MRATEIALTKQQRAFVEAYEDEVLYGGAAGGGKSYGQVLDAMLFALKFPGSKQLMLRRTYPELEKSIIRTALSVYPRAVFSYSDKHHSGKFKNGSIIDFGYCDRENDVYKYQSAEYDCIRFDELTHFTEDMYIYLISRVRGANAFPKQVKSSTNPGHIGHVWVKERFVDLGEPNTCHQLPTGTRIFIPAKVYDNTFLLEKDRDYIKRLENLSAKDQKTLLHGDWNIFEGQYFTEWDPKIHVIKPFQIPQQWRRYFAMDYGLDMLAGYFAAMDEQGRLYVYKEVYQSGLIISEAAELIKKVTSEEVYQWIAPPDLWNRRQDTDKSAADIFYEQGIRLLKSNNDRVQGWWNLHEWLSPTLDETGATIANIRFFNTCTNLIKCLPSLQVDKRNPNDCAKEPHHLTHGPDAIRYLLDGRPCPLRLAPQDTLRIDEEIDHFLAYGG